MSEWKQRANRRRDERHTAMNVRPQGGSRKNTKRWCRGVVGREHVPVCIADNRFKDWRILACKQCKRHLDRWWPSPWRVDPQIPPEWARAEPQSI